MLSKENHTLYNPASELELSKLEYRLPKFVLTASEAEAREAESPCHRPLQDRPGVATSRLTSLVGSFALVLVEHVRRSGRKEVAAGVAGLAMTIRFGRSNSLDVVWRAQSLRRVPSFRRGTVRPGRIIESDREALYSSSAEISMVRAH